MTKKRVAILISGRGSNMAALIKAAKAKNFPAEILLVLSNRPEAQGLALAQAEGIATAVVDHRAFADREEFDGALNRALMDANIELVCLAGFMRVLTDDFVERWRGRMLNIHPSLLPAFKGIRVHEQVLAAGAAVTGCTVHFIVTELDSGPIVLQSDPVPVQSGDTPETLAARVLESEHRLYPEALALVASGKARLEAGQVVFS